MKKKMERMAINNKMALRRVWQNQLAETDTNKHIVKGQSDINVEN